MRLINRIRNAIQYLPRPRRYWLWAILLLAIPILGLILSIVFWDWLNFNESRGTTVRNVGLIIAALTALPLAIWRGLVAEKQAEAAQQSLRNERYQKGAEMLGSKHLSVRLAAIYALQRLAKEYSGEYHLQILRILSAFARHPVADGVHVEEVEAKFGRPHVREDVQAAVGVINKRIVETANLESKDMSYLDLSGTELMNGDLREANLKSAFLREANLSHATLTGADMREAILKCGNLQEVTLAAADLSHATLCNTKMSGANLSNTILSGTRLSRVSGLTQAQLDQARADPNNPPNLDGAIDAKTGQPLIWTGGRGAPLKD